MGVEGEHDKQYSLLYYQRMLEQGYPLEVVGKAVESNTITWAAEYQFKLNYNEFWYQLRDGELYSDDFGEKSMHKMCDEAVEIREKAGVDLARVESEREGIIKLASLLEKIELGETVLLISPPDNTDYTMLYVYEKQMGGKVRATAIRDNEGSIEDFQVLAGYLSGVMSGWKKVDHLGFVANPLVTRLSFDNLVSELGVNVKDELPEWFEGMVARVVPAMLLELQSANIDEVVRIFDAFQMAIFSQKELDKDVDRRRSQAQIIDPITMIRNHEEWMIVQRMFVDGGGMEMVEARGQCGIGLVGLMKDGIGTNNNMLSNLMGVDEQKSSEEYSFDQEGECVVCKKHSDSVGKLGPCNICKGCDRKLQSAERV